MQKSNLNPTKAKNASVFVLFTTFLQKMDESYEEALTEFVLLGEPNNSRVTSEFVVNDSIKKLTKTHQSA